MEKLAAIVEGHTEEHFVRGTYGLSYVTRAIPNGRNVAIEVIVEAIADALELISGEITKILILLDREKREISAKDMADMIAIGLKSICGDRRLYIGVSDKMIENWIVADEKKMKAKFDSSYSYPGDGCHGKFELQKLNGGVSLGPRDTAMLLKECSANDASSNSPSLQRLISQIDFQWAWASQ
jgi:hypothetical protein